MPRQRAIVPVVAGLLLLVFWLVVPGSGGAAWAAAGAGPRAPLAGYFPNVRLRTQDGREVRFYDDLVKGKLVLINFMFTSCTELCPRGTENLAKAQQAFGEHAGRDVFFISISVDPGRDTPATLKQYAERFHAKPGWVFATGAADDIGLIRRKLGVADSDDKSQHSGMIIYGNDATGSWASMPVTTNPATIASSVLRLLELPARPGIAGH